MRLSVKAEEANYRVWWCCGSILGQWALIVGFIQVKNVRSSCLLMPYLFAVGARGFNLNYVNTFFIRTDYISSDKISPFTRLSMSAWCLSWWVLKAEPRHPFSSLLYTIMLYPLFNPPSPSTLPRLHPHAPPTWSNHSILGVILIYYRPCLLTTRDRGDILVGVSRCAWQLQITLLWLPWKLWVWPLQVFASIW